MVVFNLVIIKIMVEIRILQSGGLVVLIKAPTTNSPAAQLKDTAILGLGNGLHPLLYCYRLNQCFRGKAVGETSYHKLLESTLHSRHVQGKVGKSRHRACVAGSECIIISILFSPRN